MERAEKYLKEVNSLTTREELYKIGTQMQIDAYNQALEDAAKSATTRWNGEYIEIPINTVVVDKQSILKLKK